MVVVDCGPIEHGGFALWPSAARRLALLLNAAADEIQGSTIDPELPS